MPPNRAFEVEVVLADGSVFQNRGRVSFADPSFSKETGTFLVRAVFANPRAAILRPGQFVRVHVLGAIAAERRSWCRSAPCSRGRNSISSG